MSSTNCERVTAADGSLVALADCNNFFVSCERIVRPDLLGRPVVVLSNNDGCVVSRSNEAKALDIPMGEPVFRIRTLLHRHQVAVFSSNYALYGDLSRRVMRILDDLAPGIEVYSIDEAFLSLPAARALNAAEIGRLARERVLRWVGLPLSIGIAPTKVLAKIAGDIAKRRPELRGVCDLSRCPDQARLLARVPVEEVRGIGRKSGRKLRERGIASALDLRDAEPGRIRSLLTVGGLNILMELRGVPSLSPDEAPPNSRTIISSRSFGARVFDEASLREAVAAYTARAAEKLRARGLAAKGVEVYIRTSRHATGPACDEAARVFLDLPASDTPRLTRAAHGALSRLYRPGYAYAKAGVMLFELCDTVAGQDDLRLLIDGAGEREKKRSALMDVIDRVNREQGRHTLRFASEGTGERPWHMRRAHLSPCWTTDIKELIAVRTG